LSFNFKKKSIPKFFDQYFQPVYQTYNYSTRFATTGDKLWNKMPEKIKSSHHLSYNIFVQLVKKYFKVIKVNVFFSTDRIR